MPAAKNAQADSSPAGTQANKDIAIITESRTKRDKWGEKYTAEVPTGRMTPVVLIKSPRTFKPDHERALRDDLGNVCKKHARDGKLYFEVGESDDQIESAIQTAIASLRGMGVEAHRSIEFSPYMSRGQW